MEQSAKQILKKNAKQIASIYQPQKRSNSYSE